MILPETGESTLANHPHRTVDDTQKLNPPLGPDTTRETFAVREQAAITDSRVGQASHPAHDGRVGRGESVTEAIRHVVAAEPLVDFRESVDEVCLGSEVRRDVLSGKQTIFASGRGERPIEFAREFHPSKSIGPCPFCLGNEFLTPSTLLAVGGDDGDLPWQVRVVNNKYPAVSLLETPRTTGCNVSSHSPSKAEPARRVANAARGAHRSGNLFPVGALAGGHEVIIESPRHSVSVSELNVSHLASVYAAIASRIRLWREVPEVEYISVFKNVGAPAGASLSHAHSQLIATGMLPPRIRDTLYRVGKHYDQTGCCLQCDLLRAEQDVGQRVVLATEHFVAYCPFAAPLPYLTRIVPRAHADRFEDSDPEVLTDLAHISRRLVQCLESLFPGVAYNHVLQTRPPGAADESAFHWSMEWMPRVTTQAGFEHASDCFINPTLPETAAANLREAARRLNPLRVPQPRSGFSVS